MSNDLPITRARAIPGQALEVKTGRNVDRDGRVFVVSQESREQPRNLETAREKLAEIVKKALVRPKKRVATKPSRAAKARRVDEKKHRAKTKAGRRPVDD